MENISSAIKEKFSGLLFYLRRSKTEFEMVADEMEDHSLRAALNTLSDESCCYAGELKNYLKAIGIYPVIPETQIWDPVSDYEINPLVEGKGNELKSICTHNEESLTKAYSELMAEALPVQVLSDIMYSQLNALKYTFMKIRTLNDARFSTYAVQ